MRKRIQIGIGSSATTARGFIEAWKRAERGERLEAEHWLYFESIESLLKTLTSSRWTLLKMLRKIGPVSVRALAAALGRDYKNVHTDVRKLESIGLVSRTREDRVQVPWDIVEARLRLAA
jgi:predicted transcriptional regulator